LLQHGGRVSCKSALLLEVGETLAEGKMTGQLDKAKEVAAPDRNRDSKRDSCGR